MNTPAFLRFVITFFLLLIFFNGFAQTPTINSVQSSVEAMANNFPQEKIYLQYDKPSYAPGETVWFKAYLMAGADPSPVSKTLYIDFISANGRILKHCIEPVLQASAAGDYAIPLDFKNENIYVKAYTRWMQNFDSAFWYRKTLPIVQTKPAVKKLLVPAVKAQIQFLPEGGDMIESLESNIAFKALRFDGTPELVKGAVFNNNNQQVAAIKTVHDGMGSFKLTPETGETYTAKWKDEWGDSYETKLPAAKPSGALLTVALQPTARSFLIQRSENSAVNFQKLYIVATMQQHLVYAAAVDLSQTLVTGGAIPVSDLPSGILQITLFDSNWVALAERITFINNNNYWFQPEVGFAQLGLEKRKPNTLVIKTPDSLSASLSVSVTDANVGIDSSDDITSHLLLTADVKGSVYHPSYYFTGNSDTLQQQLDLVMMTNGWRRINWQNVLQNKYPDIKYANDTDYLNLSGRVFGATQQDLQRGAFIVMIITNKKDTAHHIQQLPVAENSTFANPNIILYDTSTIYYRISGTESFANSSVVTFNGSMPAARITLPDTSGNALFTDTAMQNFIRRLADEKLQFQKFGQGTNLGNVTVQTKVKSPMQLLDERYTSPLFSNGDAYQFDALNDPFAKTGQSVFTYLQGKVAGLTISTPSGGSNPSVSWRGGTPTFFLDESEVDASFLSSLSMNDVAYIKVFRPPFIGAVGGGANGAIAIYTRRGGDVQAPKSKGIPYKVIIGYTAPEEFYSPDYDTYDERNEQPDLRTTLYWAPMILTTPANNTIKLKFFNNDITNSFRIIVEGVATDGKLTHIEKVIE